MSAVMALVAAELCASMHGIWPSSMLSAERCPRFQLRLRNGMPQIARPGYRGCASRPTIPDLLARR